MSNHVIIIRSLSISEVKHSNSLETILQHSFRHYFDEYYPCAVLKVKHHKNEDYMMANPTLKVKPLMIDENIVKDLVPPEEFDPNEPLEILRLYR